MKSLRLKGQLSSSCHQHVHNWCQLDWLSELGRPDWQAFRKINCRDGAASKKAKPFSALRDRPSGKREGNVQSSSATESQLQGHPHSARVERRRGEDRGLRILPHRGGYVLVLVAMMLFGLFAMAALVIDLGFARVAQSQMQSAADAAALEGLRGEGAVLYEDRQIAAERFIAWTFDDELGAINSNAGSVDFGAVVNFSDGAGDPGLNASRLKRVDATNVTDIQRRPNSLAANNFSVAVQRGGVIDGEFDLLAHGSSVPFLFARGSLLNRGAIGDGIATGGVARAITDHALVVGQPVNDTAGNEIYPGAIPVGYTLADWNGLRSDPRQVSPSKLVVGELVNDGGVATPVDGFCCIFTTINGVDRVVGFGKIENGVALPSSVAAANAIGRQGSAWNQINATVRDDVLTQNDTIIGGLMVARLAPGT